MPEQSESTDQQLQAVEQTASQLTDRLQSLERAVSQLEAATNRLAQRGDQAVAAAVQSNLTQRIAERQELQEQQQQVLAQLEQIGQELEQARRQDERSAQELDQLASLGEDVQSGRELLNQRQTERSRQQQTLQVLMSSLEFTGFRLRRDPSTFIYKTGDDINEQIRWTERTGNLQAAQERYQVGIAAQQADSLGDAVLTLLQSRHAGQGPQEMAAKMVRYIQAQNSVSPQVFDKMLAADKAARNTSLDTSRRRRQS